MFNLHIGLPGILPNLIHTVAQVEALADEGSSCIISRELWQNQFSKLLNSKQSEFALNVAALRESKDTLAKLTLAHPTIAASQHDLLGSAKGCFINKKALPFTEARIERLLSIFSSVPLVLHLSIHSQFDYFKESVSQMEIGNALPQPFIIPSWFELVQRIKETAPSTPIVVWDFERPERVVLEFSVSLLCISDHRAINAISQSLQDEVRRTSKVPLVTRNDCELPCKVIAQMDKQYEFDLNSISRMEGVSLIRP